MKRLVDGGLLVWALGLTAFITMGLTIPNTFAPNTVASAAQVNANFAAVDTAVDALEAANGPTSQGKLRGYVFFTGSTGAVGNSFMTTGGTPLVTRNSAGNYTITWPGESIFFNSDPTTITFFGSPDVFCRSDSSGGNQLIFTNNAAGTPTDPNTLLVMLYNDT